LNPALIPVSSIPQTVASGSGYIQTPAPPNQATPAVAIFFNPLTNPAPVDGLYLITLTLTSPYPDGGGTATWFDSNGALLWQFSDNAGNYYYQGSATASTLPNASQIAGADPGTDYNGIYTFQNIVYLNAGDDYSFEIYAFAGVTPAGVWNVPYTFDLSYLG